MSAPRAAPGPGSTATSAWSSWATTCSALPSSTMLYRAFPDADEGELSQRLADLVRKESCAEVAQDWQVGPHMRLGPGEVQTGGRRKAAILANICESVIGAVFLDGGYAAAEAFIERHWSRRMMSPVVPVRDPKIGAAGMGAGARPAAAGLSRGRARGAGPLAALHHRRGAARPAGGRGRRPLQAAGRAVRGRGIPGPAGRHLRRIRHDPVSG